MEVFQTFLKSLDNVEIGAFKLISTILLTYPIAIVYQYFFTRTNHYIKQFYLIICGISLAYFNYGNNVIHLLITILVNYITLYIKPCGFFTLAFNFIFTFTYLSIGQFLNQSSNYSFEWTIPHCVLTLRLIALSFNVYDSNQLILDEKKKDSKIKNKSKELYFIPPLINVLGHCFFPITFLVGPQYEIYIYNEFLNRKKNTIQYNLKQSLIKFSIGITYLLIYQIGSENLKPDFLYTQTFFNYKFLWKVFFIAILSKVHLMKYISVWLLIDGSCYLIGLTQDHERKIQNEINNVDLVIYESTITFDGLIRSFNLTTNKWAAKYIYKRLKFLNMKAASHIITLFFLALWHGFKSGYYVSFLLEFFYIINEKQTITILNNLRCLNPSFNSLIENKLISFLSTIFLRCYVICILSYCFLPLLLLSYENYFPVLKNTFFYGHLNIFLVALLNYTLKKIYNSQVKQIKVKSNK